MPIEKVNITDDQNAETNVDWLATGERMTEDNLNRPVKQVAQVLNNAIDDIESEFANLTIGTSNALQQEITDRTNADNVLEEKIDTEIATRKDDVAYLSNIARAGKNALNLNPYFDLGFDHWVYEHGIYPEPYVTKTDDGNAIFANGWTTLRYVHKIPIKRDRTYKVRVTVKSTGSLHSRMYAGVACYDKDGIEETLPRGRRWCATDFETQVPSDGYWHVYEGTITGTGSSTDQHTFGSTTVYVSPIIIVNFEQGTAAAVIIEEVGIEDITEVIMEVRREKISRTIADNSLQAAINLINTNGLPASIINTIDQFTYSDSGNVQDVLDDLDHAINEIVTKKAVYVSGSKVITNNDTRNTRWETASSLYNNTDINYVNIYPPNGYTMSNLKAFIASPRLINFGGTVNSDDTLFCYWLARDNYIRVVCNNTENRGSASINYLAIWRKD